MSEWQDISTAPEGEAVDTKIDDHLGVRSEQSLIRRGRLWFTVTSDRKAACCYVYYTPTHWRNLPDPPTK